MLATGPAIKRNATAAPASANLRKAPRRRSSSGTAELGAHGSRRVPVILVDDDPTAIA